MKVIVRYSFYLMAHVLNIFPPMSSEQSVGLSLAARGLTIVNQTLRVPAKVFAEESVNVMQ